MKDKAKAEYYALKRIQFMFEHPQSQKYLMSANFVRLWDSIADNITLEDNVPVRAALSCDDADLPAMLRHQSGL